MKYPMWSSLAVVAGLAFAPAANAQIKIGVAGPMTGPNAAFGAQALQNNTTGGGNVAIGNNSLNSKKIVHLWK